jgi:hypothetical protein
MACLLEHGFLLACNEGVGGVKNIYIANWEYFASGITIDAATGIIDGLPGTSGSVDVFQYQPNRNTGALTVAPTANLENGTLYYEQTVELTLGKLDYVKKKELENMSKAKLIVFVQLYDNQIVCVGRTDGAFLTTGSYQSGKAKGDLNGYQITLTAQEPQQPDFLEEYFPASDVPFSNFTGITVVNS